MLAKWVANVHTLLQKGALAELMPTGGGSEGGLLRTLVGGRLILVPCDGFKAPEWWRACRIAAHLPLLKIAMRNRLTAPKGSKYHYRTSKS